MKDFLRFLSLSSSTLINRGVVNKNNALHSSSGNLGENDEYQEVTFGVSGNSIQ